MSYFEENLFIILGIIFIIIMVIMIKSEDPRNPDQK